MTKLGLRSPWIADSVFIADQHQRYEKVFKADILYIQAEGGVVDIVTVHKTYNLATNLGTVEPQLDPAYFVRVSRKHMINIHRVEVVQGNVLTVAGQEIVIGRQFRAALLDRLPILRTKHPTSAESIPFLFSDM